MIANVVAERGDRTRGLVEYLWSPGRFNEHTDPHIVAAWDPTFVRPPGETLDSFERGLLAREMEAPLRMFDKGLGDHVYHVSVSIHADDGELTDEQWAEVAQRGAEELGFTETQDRAAVPWVAVRHGLSEKGNDHIHFVAVLCRESGQTPETHYDFAKWKTVRQEFDAKWNLRTGRESGAGMPGLEQAEIAKAARQGEPEPARSELARRVRGAASAARDEADWLRRMRRSGVLVRPRWEQGGTQTVVGYSVALKPTDKDKLVWFGGGKLAPDLTLARVRETWSQPDADTVAEIRREWRPAGWRQMPTAQQLQQQRLRSETWDKATDVVQEMRQRVVDLSPQDHRGWAQVARETSGALSALAVRAEPKRKGPLSRAADQLSRSAQTSDRTADPRVATSLKPMAGVARAVSDAALARSGGAMAMASLVSQLGRIVRDIERVHHASERHVQARQAETAAENLLTFVRQTPTANPGQQRLGERAQPHMQQRGAGAGYDRDE